MLTVIKRRAMEYESIHNYYEKPVIEYVHAKLGAQQAPDRLADIACVALNHLPPRYIRYDVDMTFYLSPHEANEMATKIATAVEKAITLVEQREAEHSKKTLS